MKHTALLLAAISFLIPAIPGIADDTSSSDSDNHKILFVRTAKDTVVYKILEDQRELKFGESPVPHFAIHTLNNSFVMTIGGQISPIFGADLGNDLYSQDGAGISFVTNRIPVTGTDSKKADFFINPLQAYIDLQVVGFGGTKNQITGYIKIGTNGLNNNIHLKRAYVSWRGFTAGLKQTLFQDGLACQPPTIDPQGPCGEIAGSAYEISYISPSFKGFRCAIGASMPSYYASNGRYLGKDYKKWNGKDILNQVVCDPEAYNQMVPDIPMWVEWAKSPYNRIRLRGIIRTFNYKDVLAGKRRTSVGWGLMLSGNLNPVKPLILYAQACYGKGIGNYIQDLAGIPLSFTPRSDDPGRMTPTPELGLVVGATWNFNTRWQANAMYSMARMWKVGPYALSEGVTNEFNNYRYANYMAANVFYNISSFFQVGVEYLYGQRHTWYAGQGHDNRIQAQFSFTL